jgi:hypothetical protein
MGNPRVAEEFYERTGFAKLLGWYLHHPVKTVHFVTKGLLWEAEIMRANNLGNYRAGEGREACARTRRFALWSDIRSALFHRAPWYLPLWYGLFVAGCVTTILRRRAPASVRLAWLAMGIVCLGAGEFTASNLADCLDMARHLYLFHACTDLTVCFAVAGAVGLANSRKKDRALRVVSKNDAFSAQRAAAPSRSRL